MSLNISGNLSLPSGAEGDFLVNISGQWTPSQDDPRLSFLPQVVPPGGRLCVAPAYIQPSGDSAIVLTSASHKVALGFVPEVDFALFAISLYITDIVATGNLTIGLYSEDSAIEPNGWFFSTTTNSLAQLAANGSDCSATSEASGKDAFKAFNYSIATDDGWRSAATPTGGSPQTLVRDLGAGNERAFNRFRLWSYSNSDANVRCFPKTFTIDADQGDDNWVNLVTKAAETDPGWDATASQYREYCISSSTAYRRYRVNITDRNGTGSYVSIGEFEAFLGMSRPAPGALLQSLGTLAVGESADTWVRHTFTSYQLKQGVRYWLEFTGEAAKNFSLSKRRLNTSNGSMFPAGCVAVESTDGGTTWTESQQDSLPALLNVVLNSSSHHVPQLTYGRYSGPSIPLYNGTDWALATIPEAGITLSLEEHSAPDSVYGYRIFVYDNSGTLTLTGEKVDTVKLDGAVVKSGSVDRRLVGLAYPVERLTGYFAPISSPDEALVWNQDNRKDTIVGKGSPYATDTHEWITGLSWTRWAGDAYRGRVLVGVPTSALTYLGGLAVYGTNYATQDAMALDSISPNATDNSISCLAQASLTQHVALAMPVCYPGIHSLWPVSRANKVTRLTYFQQTDAISGDPNAWVKRMWHGSIEM